ncbi:MAG: pyrimidine utilization protein D [Collimonas sp.]|uniref:pyrimidine utilization protein D n=1 Tax=Collimonas sp. TaxID=1963772 RepID=UPI003264FCCB
MHYEVLGRREAGVPTVLLSSGLGGLGSFWRPQLAALVARFRVIVYDQRGTGKSVAELPSDYSIAAMADDVLEIADRVGIAQMHFIGHALGGLVGMQVALQSPQLIRRMIVINGWARADSHTARCFAVRKDLLRDSGVAAYVRAQPIFLYPAPWLSANAQSITDEEQHAIAHFPGTANTLARIGALLKFDLSERLATMQVPTLVIAARDDVLVPYTCSEQLAVLLPASRLQLLDSGGHGFTVTDAAGFNRAAIDFLQD